MKKPSGCYGKKRHPTKAGALIAARKMDSKLMNAYLCRHCGKWHLGTSINPIRVQERFDYLLRRHAATIKTIEPTP